MDDFLVHNDDSLGLNPYYGKGFLVQKGIPFTDAIQVGLAVAGTFSAIPDPHFIQICRNYGLSTDRCPNLFELGCFLGFKLSFNELTVEAILPPWLDFDHIKIIKRDFRNGFNSAYDYLRQLNNLETVGDLELIFVV
ncbi:MAG: hypothetical protein NZO16_06485, partial [Deltaproteobacteria bacterium]|nr:hypothetical protein [Deltaproteobacteria bacterium]